MPKPRTYDSTMTSSCHRFLGIIPVLPDYQYAVKTDY